MMRLLLLLTFVVAAIIWLAAQAGAAECLGSAGEVWKEHPHSRATWHNVEGHKCWSEDHRRKQRTKVAKVPIPKVSPHPVAAPEPVQLSRIDAAFADMEAADPPDVLLVDRIEQTAWRIKLAAAMRAAR